MQIRSESDNASSAMLSRSRSGVDEGTVRFGLLRAGLCSLSAPGGGHLHYGIQHCGKWLSHLRSISLFELDKVDFAAIVHFWREAGMLSGTFDQLKK